MPPSAGRQPPESPVPAPRATNGRPSRLASFTTAETCSADAREDDEVGERAEEREPVGLVHQELVGIGEHRARADDRLELAAELGLPESRQGRHGVSELSTR